MNRRQILRGALTSALVLGVPLVPIAQSVYAATSSTSEATQEITGGTRDVEITPSVTFEPITLNGESQQTTANPGVLAIKDASGTGEGYRVSVEASQFRVKTPSGGFASGTSARTLPLGSLKLAKEGSKIEQEGTESGLPDWTGNDFVIDNGSPVNIIRATKDNGMGKYKVTFGEKGLTLSFAPSTTYVDKVNYPTGATPYTSTLTYQIVTGP